MNQNLNLNGLNPLAYVGVNAYTPPPFVNKAADPTATDYQNFYIGSIWLNTATEDVWMLVAKAAGVSTWVKFTGSNGSLLSLSDTAGTKVFPLLNNIQLVGTSPLTVTSDPGNNLLTFALSGSGVVGTLTGNSGGAVSPTAGNIDILGSGVITVVGNPGTSTLTVTPSGDIASSFITNPATGTATPVAGVLTFAGANGVSVSAAGSTVTITGPNTYSTGTFVPTITFGAGDGSDITYGTQIGVYTQIGSQVTVAIRVDLTSKGAQTGVARCRGLPFTPATQSAYSLTADTLTFAGDYIQAQSGTGAAYFTFRETTSGGGAADLTDAAFANTTSFLIGATYLV